MKKIGSFFRSKWEVFKYNRRKAARTKKNTPTIWRSHLKLVSEELKLLHEVEAEKFDEKLIDNTIDAYKELNRKINKIWVTSYLMVAYLVLTTFDIELPISVLGIKLTSAPGLNEVLITLIAVLTAFNIGNFISSITILISAKTIMELVHEDGFKYFSNLRSNLDDVPAYCRPTMMPHLTWTKSMFFASWYMVMFLGLKVLFFAFVFFSWRFLIYIEIFKNPTISQDLAHIAVTFALVVDIISVVFLLIYIVPLPHRDYLINQKFEVLKQLQPEKYNEMCREVYGEDWDDEAYMIRNGYLK